MSGMIVAQYGVANAGQQHELGWTTRRRSNSPAMLGWNEGIRRAMHHQQ